MGGHNVDANDPIVPEQIRGVPLTFERGIIVRGLF